MNEEQSYHHQQPIQQQQHQRTTSAPLRPVDSGTLSHSNSGTTVDAPTEQAPRHNHDPTYLTSIPMPIATASAAVPQVTSSPPQSAPSFQIQQLVDPSDLHKLYSLQPGMNVPQSPPSSSKAASSGKAATTAASSSTSGSSTSGVSKLKLHSADFAHRMDDTAVLRSRRDWSFVRDGWPAKASMPMPIIALPVTKQQPNRRGGNGANAASFAANPSDSNQAVASFLYVTCLPPGLIDLDPIARTQLAEPESSSNAKSRLVRESTCSPFQQQQQQASNNGSPSSNSPTSKSRADAARKLARPPAAPSSDPVLNRARPVRPQSADPAGRRGTLAAATQVMTLPVYSPLSDTDPQPHTPSPPAASDASSSHGHAHSHARPSRPSSAGGGSSSGFPARPRSAGLRAMLPLKRHGSGESTGSGSGGSSSSGSIHLQQHHRPHHHRHHHRSASPGYVSTMHPASAMSNPTLYSPSRQMASGSQALSPSINRLPGLRKLSSLFPGSNAAVLSSCNSMYSSTTVTASQVIVQPTVPRAGSNALTIDLAADMQSLGLSGTRCVSSSASPPPPNGAAPSRAGFASASSPTGSSSSAASPKPPSKRPSIKPRNHRTAAAAVASLMHATPASTSVAAAAAAAAAIVQVAAADVIHAATVGGGVGGGGAGVGGGGGGGGGMASVGIGVSSKYNRMSALPRLEFARVKYAT